MKRGTDGNDPASAASQKAPRQDPVSCQTCRKRKLKCDRANPCGSCAARKLECIYASRELGVVPSPKQPSAHTQRPDAVVPKEACSKPSTTSVRSQVYPSAGDTIENAAQYENHTNSWPPTSDRQAPTQPGDESVATVERLETIVMGHWIPNAVPTILREDSTSREQNSMPYNTPIVMSEWQQSMMAKYRTLVGESPTMINLPSHLPSEDEAMCILRYYCAHLDFQYHVVHPGRTEKQIRGMYDAINRQRPIDLSHAALLFSIAASTLYYKLQGEPSDYADVCSQGAAFLTGAALMQRNYIAYPTLEGLQATMIIGHNLSNTSLPSAVSSLFVHRLFVNQAINMKLHLLDCPRSGNDQASEGPDKALLELKRRIWWDLVSYDWLLSYLSGPQQWTYSITPHQMNVRLPLNIEDDKIGQTDDGAPLSSPTVMTYSLCRLKLAAVSREIADESAQKVFYDQELPYERILEHDRKLRDSMNELPEFFRFGQKAQREYAALYRERPAFAWQRSMLVLGYHFRFCRLHRRYFVRGAKDPKYSYSHVICLQSARTVLEVKRVMDEEEPILTPSSSLIWAVMHHVFMAAVILLLDLCFNWEDVLAEKRKEEVLAACRLLTRAQQSSTVAHRAVDAMMEVLRKHWKSNKGPPCPAADAQPQADTWSKHADGNLSEPTPKAHDSESTGYVPPLGDPQPLPFDAPLEDLWTDMLDGTANPTLDTTDWTDLLTELTNAPFPVE